MADLSGRRIVVPERANLASSCACWKNQCAAGGRNRCRRAGRRTNDRRRHRGAGTARPHARRAGVQLYPDNPGAEPDPVLPYVYASEADDARVLANQKGAVLELSGRQVGLMANADLSGLAITLK